MGLFKNAKLIKAAYTDAMATVPRWAKIVEIGRKIGPITTFQLELHHHYEPVQVVTTQSWVPRGVTPVVGQDVAFHVSHGDDHTHYEIDWEKPPQYGLPRDERPPTFAPPPGFTPPPGFPQPPGPPPAR